MSEPRKTLAPVIVDGPPAATSDEEFDAFEIADDVVQTSDQEFQRSNHKNVQQGGASGPKARAAPGARKDGKVRTPVVWSSDEEEQLEEEVEEVQVVEEEEDVEEEYEGGTYYTDEELTRAAGSKTANEKKRQRGSFASTPPSVTLKGGKYAPKSATAKSVQKPQTSPRLHAIHMRPDVLLKVPRLDKQLGGTIERGLRLPFTTAEEDALRRGVLAHPPIRDEEGSLWYQWAAILNDPELRPLFHSSRTTVNLKDKWRTNQKHEKAGTTPVKRARKSVSRDSLITLHVISASGAELFDVTVMGWSSVGSLCRKILTRWGTADGYIVFPNSTISHGRLTMYTTEADVVISVEDAGGHNFGNVIALPELVLV